MFSRPEPLWHLPTSRGGGPAADPRPPPVFSRGGRTPDTMTYYDYLALTTTTWHLLAIWCLGVRFWFSEGEIFDVSESHIWSFQLRIWCHGVRYFVSQSEIFGVLE